MYNDCGRKTSTAPPTSNCKVRDALARQGSTSLSKGSTSWVRSVLMSVDWLVGRSRAGVFVGVGMGVGVVVVVVVVA